MVKRFVIGLLLVLASPVVAAAQKWEDYDYENLRLSAVGLSLGALAPSRVDNTLGVSLHADLGFLGPNVRITSTLGYWGSALRGREVQRLADQLRRLCERQPTSGSCQHFDLGEIQVSDLHLGADAAYVFQAFEYVEPYAGAGLAVHLLNGRGAAINGTFVEDLLDTLSPGMSVHGGLQTAVLRPVTLFGEARYTLSPDVRYPSVSFGAMVRMPPAAPHRPVAVAPSSR